MSSLSPQRLPPWTKVRLPGDGDYSALRRALTEKRLHTVCESARCPNQGECWGSGTATFMILGDRCTRRCHFCNVATGKPTGNPAPHEPERVADAARAMNLRYVVITSVDRDDLGDGGAQHFVDTVRAVRRQLPDVTVEVLTPDFGGQAAAILSVAQSGAVVIGHNLETVRRLTTKIRDRRAGYALSLDVLQRMRRVSPQLIVKSALMLGLGENLDEVDQAMQDLRAVGVDWLTLGQYLRPSRKQVPVAHFYPPQTFAELKKRADALGFALVSAGPLVRSSYRAGEARVPSLIAARQTAAS